MKTHARKRTSYEHLTTARKENWLREIGGLKYRLLQISRIVELYNLMKQAFDARTVLVMPLRSKDNTKLLTSMLEISKWICTTGIVIWTNLLLTTFCKDPFLNL